MDRLVVEGGRPLSGLFVPAGNKNAALPMIAASLLTDQPIVLHRVPAIDDVNVLLDILAGLGVDICRNGSSVRLCAAALSSTTPDPDLCRQVRASILLAAPLAARHGTAVLPPPGGDVIGRRRLDTHVSGLSALGFEVQAGEYLELKRTRLRGIDLLLDEASVTATENILMAAALTEGTTTVFHAACEPHVQDLCRLLSAMGARIEGHGTNRVVIQGVSELHGAETTIGPDYVELGSFIAASAITGGTLQVEGVTEDIATRVLRRGFQKLGIDWRHTEKGLHLVRHQPLQIQPDLGAAIPKIEDGIWPAFPSDLMSVAIVAATQAGGSILFFEKLFESRMYFVDRLIEMGAQIVQCDPHRVVVQGPCRLRSTHMTSPDIRAGMAMVLAALAADGTSVIENAHMIDRGYERIDERLRSLGAAIQRES